MKIPVQSAHRPRPSGNQKRQLPGFSVNCQRCPSLLLTTMMFIQSIATDTRVVYSRSHPVPVSLALSSPGLSAMVQHARFLQQLDARLRSELPASLARHVQVANLHADRLVMVAESAVWATRLRY